MATTKKVIELIKAQDKERLAARLERNLLRTESCIEWTGAKNNSGYGKINFRFEGQHVQLYAHRLFWILANQRVIPSHLVIDHKCCNRCCVNPAHLQLVTQKTNVNNIYRRKEKA